MKQKFEDIFNEIKKINEEETKTLAFKLLKFNEEYGEFNAEIIKMLGQTYKKFDEKDLKSEMADTLQCLLSIYNNIFEQTSFNMEDVLDEIKVKNKKWEEKIKDYKNKQ